MKYGFVIRNAKRNRLPSGIGLGGKIWRWSEGSSLIERQVRVNAVRWLLRSREVPRCVVGESCALKRFILELRGHLRWWSYGAFGNKGRLEGGQYLAGRRAPPLLLG